MTYEEIVKGLLPGVPEAQAFGIFKKVEALVNAVFTKFGLEAEDWEMPLKAQSLAFVALDQLLTFRNTELVQLNQTYKTDCDKGCSHCCHLRVPTTPSQVLLIKLYLESCPSQRDLERMKKKISEKATLARRMTTREWETAHLTCPLLDHGLCLVYPIRPLACRGYNSISEADCQAKLNDFERKITVDQVQLAITTLFELLYCETIAALSLDTRPVELISALDTAMQDDLAVEKWLEGDLDLFDGCVHIPDQDRR